MRRGGGGHISLNRDGAIWVPCRLLGLDSDLSVLIDACCRGDDAAWRDFTGKFHRLIASVVFRHGARAAPQRSAEDLVQEVYLRLCQENFRVLRDLRSKDSNSVAAFVRVTALSVVYDHYRSLLAGKRGGSQTVASYDDLVREVADPSGGQAALDRHLLLDQVDRVLKAADVPDDSERNRTIFWLYYRHGLTARAIAGIPAFGLTPKGVESAIQRLSRLVRKALAGGQYAKDSSEGLRPFGGMG